MTISLICAIQCALAPILLGLASALPGWAHFGHGWIWISIIFLIALFSIGKGFLKHQNKQPVFFAAIGLGFLLLGNVLEHKISLYQESVIFVIGGVSLAWAHWKNYQSLNACQRSS
jgi:uncharacterized RDD family membrane protein YckC